MTTARAVWPAQSTSVAAAAVERIRLRRVVEVMVVLLGVVASVARRWISESRALRFQVRSRLGEGSLVRVGARGAGARGVGARGGGTPRCAGVLRDAGKPDADR